MENGLPSNGIKGLQWDDSTELLWIATEAGISKFNGINFQNYTRNNSNPNDADRVLFMIKNWDNQIFSIDLQGSIFTVQKNKLLTYASAKKENKTNQKHFVQLLISEKSFQKNTSAKPPFSYTPIKDKILLQSDSSCLLIQNQQLYSYNTNQSTLKKIGTFDKELLGAFTQNGISYVVSHQLQIKSLNHPEQTYQLRLNDRIGHTISSNNDKKFLIWETGMASPLLFLDSLVYKIRKGRNGMEAELICDKVPTDALIEYAQYSEKRQLLFIGTNSKGITVISTQHLLALKNPRYDKRSRNAVYSQFELEDGNVLTNEGQIIGKAPIKTDNLPIQNNFNLTLSVTEDSLLWFSQRNGFYGKHILQNFNLKTGKRQLFPKIDVNQMLPVVKTGRGTFVAGAWGVGILIEDSVHQLCSFLKEGSSPSLLYDMKVRDENNLLVAKCDGVFNLNLITQQLDTLFYNTEFCVRTLWLYKGYVIWGTYGNGYFMMKNDKTLAMPKDRNNYLAYAHCFLPDGKGFCWISTNNGLFKVLFSDLEAFFEGKSDHVYYHYSGKNDGMEITELNGGCTPCAIQLKSGLLSFPTMDGLVWANPLLTDNKLPDGPFYIDQIHADGKIIAREEAKQLPYDTRLISIRPEISSWGNPENLYLDYKLDDNSNWQTINVTNNGEIQLANMVPGMHILKIRKLNGFGPNNFSMLELKVGISIPWFKKWWFYVLTILFVSGTIALILRIRTNQLLLHQRKLEQLIDEKTHELKASYELLEQNNNLKTRLISIISHDLVTPLKFLSMTGRRLAKHHEQLKLVQLEEMLGEMSKTTDELHQLSTNILNWIKYKNDHDWLQTQNIHLHSLIAEVIGILAPIAKQQGLHLINHVPTSIYLVEFLDPLKIVLYNLLSNAIRYSENSEVKFSFIENNNQKTIVVEDEGKGMSPIIAEKIMNGDYHFSIKGNENKKGYGLGYMIVMDLIKLMGAELKINSSPGKGTAVYIHLG
jgi:signal transduction histidine kinase/ligand-binding sensor domain-containing protein